MQSSIYRSVLVATAGSACLLTTQGAFAQSVTAGAETDTLQEVIVTATKRAENLQTVPLSVSVVSQERLQSENLAATYDRGGRATGLAERKPKFGSATARKAKPQSAIIEQYCRLYLARGLVCR